MEGLSERRETGTRTRAFLCTTFDTLPLVLKLLLQRNEKLFSWKDPTLRHLWSHLSGRACQSNARLNSAILASF